MISKQQGLTPAVGSE